MTPLPAITIRSGKSSEFPVRPPNRSAGFFDQDNGLLYIATPDMTWELINAAAGSANSYIYVSDFVYNTVSPLALFVAAAGDQVERVKIIVDTAFNGTVSFTVGDVGNTSRFMAAGDSDPSETGLYEKPQSYEFPGSTQVNLYLSVTGGSAGVGQVVTIIRKN